MLQQPSALVRQLLQSLSDSGVSIQKIGQLIGEDDALSEDILRYANSKVLGFGREIPDTSRALLLLGASTVQTLVACHALVRSVPRDGESDTILASFWEDATRRAVIARKLSRRYTSVSPDTAFVLGLCLEFGGLILAVDNTGAPFIPHEIRAAWGETRLECERERYGTTHEAAFSSEVSGWGIPRELVRAVGGHHLRESTLEKIAGWADSLAELFTASEPLTALDACLDMMRKEAGMTSDEVFTLLADTDQQMRYAGRLLGVPLPRLETWEAVYKRCQANKPLEEMSREELLEITGVLRGEKAGLEKERDALRAELHRMASLDPLTGLPNRKRYLDALHRELSKARQHRRPLSLMLVDIDGFTSINERHGEASGDEVLRRAASILTRVVRDAEAVFRVGPDTFAMLMPEIGGRGGRVYAERVRAALESLKVDSGNTRIRLSGTVVGISLDAVPSAISADHERLHCFALRALSSAQSGGQNQASWAA